MNRQPSRSKHFQRGRGISQRAPHPPLRRPDQPVLTIRAQTKQRHARRFVHDALEEIRHYLHDLDITAEGPPVTILHQTARPDTIDIEVAWPTDHPASGAGRIHGGTLPTALTSPSQHEQPDHTDSDSPSLL